MKKVPILLFLAAILCTTASGQVMVSKFLGPNAKYAQLGWGIFAYYELPLHHENESIRIELLDFAFWPSKNSDSNFVIGYLSIKAGYKYVFSETNAGFYIEPQAGWCRVVNSNNTQTLGSGYGDGLALALEGGYCLAVGRRDNTLNFGIKYESDLAGSVYNANSIGFRVSLSYHLFRRN
jgi:hypothetical protein